MNKSILKHELRSTRYVRLLFIVLGLLIGFAYHVNLNMAYENIITFGVESNKEFLANNSTLGSVVGYMMLLFSILSIVQIYIQFRLEKSGDVAMFLSALPIKKESFLIVKLFVGILNLTLGFLVILISVLIIRNNNIFWIEDLYRAFISSESYFKAASIPSILLKLGLGFLFNIWLYSFFFMIQYSFSNVVAGIVTAFFVSLAPVFIIVTIKPTLQIFGLELDILNNINTSYLMFFSYPLDSDLKIIAERGNYIYSIEYIYNIGYKYLILIVNILINILLAFRLRIKFNIEDSGKIIMPDLFKNIFIFGVTLCSVLLISTLIIYVFSISFSPLIFAVILAAAGLIGFMISSKIGRVGRE